MAQLLPPTPLDLSQVNKLQDKLDNSSTAYTPNAQPSLDDLRNQLSVSALQDKIQAYANQQARVGLYGNEPAPTTDLAHPLPAKEGVVGRALHALATPLYGIVGATESVLGKGTSGKGFLPDVVESIKGQHTFGDLLKKEGVNKWVSLPLGFALDVVADPVNWLTAGGALIPKLSKGVYKGGLEGLETASRSYVLSKADTLANRVPFLSKVLTPESWKSSIASKALEAEDAYRAAVKLPSVTDEIISSSQKTRLGDSVMKLWKSSPIPGFKNFDEHFKYSPGEYWQNLKKTAESEAQQVASGARAANWRDLSDTIRGEAMFGQNADMFSNDLLSAQLGSNYEDIARNLRDAAYNPPARGLLAEGNSLATQNSFSDAASQTEKFNQLLGEELRANRNNTGSVFYDSIKQRMNNSKVLSALGNFYENALGLFKVTKVSMNPTSYTNAIIGNGVMASMIGVNVTDPAYLNALRDARRLVNGKSISPELASALSTSEDFSSFITKYKKLAEQFGLSESMINESLSKRTLEDIARESSDFFNNSSTGMMGKEAKTAENVLKKVGSKAAEAANKIPVEEDLGGISPDIFFGQFGSTVGKMRQGGYKYLPENTQKWLAGKVDQFTSYYNQIDKTYKIGTTMHLATNGVTYPELKTISKFVRFEPGDLTQVGNRYKLSFLKAGEVANEAFMNYNAMPTAVKVLRTLPILGSPFASFTYASLVKGAKTLVNNPGIMKRITFLKNEVSRVNPASPLEKVALGQQYYNYLNAYERMKLPFFQQHPVYLNIANWLPYTGLNQFQPSERQSTNDASSIGGQLIDRLPFLKTPEGQILYDYFIQPYVLQEDQPTGQFGQPLYGENDSNLQKLLIKPATAALQAELPPLIPPGYRGTQFINAVQGKTSSGLQTKQPASALTWKWLFGTLGAPANDIDLNNLSSSIKQQLNPKKK